MELTNFSDEVDTSSIASLFEKRCSEATVTDTLSSASSVVSTKSCSVTQCNRGTGDVERDVERDVEHNNFQIYKLSRAVVMMSSFQRNTECTLYCCDVLAP